MMSPLITATAIVTLNDRLRQQAQAYRRTGTPLVGGDAEWYREQDEHIRLQLPLVEEARQGWWHEVTRRIRENGESADASADDGTTLLHVAALAGRRKLVEELLARSAGPRARDSYMV